MIGETANIEAYNTPEMGSYDKQDAEHYYEGFDEEAGQSQESKMELDYEETADTGERVSDEQLSKDTKESIKRLKSRKIGYQSINAAIRISEAA